MRGEIRWYRFGQPDKRRPVLVLTRDSVLDYLGEVTIAPITRTVRGLPSEVPLTAADGMPRDCAINCDHLQTVSKQKLGPVIASLRHDRLEEVRAAVLFALGFGP
ncbi:MAG TPA: type II toxin-antitoxin system PemK/MazF family toxin [Thermoanaerobaculia bacterium]|nr:type II toxin-antitoxin system PemK/MazF family toxin [Thermoanaerobaculia bacterium]